MLSVLITRDHASSMPTPLLYHLQRSSVPLLEMTEVQQGSADGPAVPPPGGAAHPAIRVWTPVPGHGAICQDGPLPPLCRPKQIAGHVQRVRVLTYNLKWWATFGNSYRQQQPHGNLITYRLKQWNAALPFDVLGFQECADGEWLLVQAGLAADYQIFRARQCCMAYRKTSWNMLSSGAGYVATDEQYGLRPAQWLRLQHKQTHRTMFFVNHHGPMPVDSGGCCGGESSAYQILKLISLRAQCGDALVLVGDFNMGPSSPTITRLKQRLQIFSHSNGQQIDHIFSNLPRSAILDIQNLGSYGSDHDALSATFQLGTGPLPAKSSTSTLAPTLPIVPGLCAGNGDDPYARGSEQRCCPGLKKCKRKGQDWSFRCQPCQAPCPDEPRRDFAARPCEAPTTTEQPVARGSHGGSDRWPASNSVELVLLGSDGACVQEGNDPFTSGDELLCCMGLKKCLQKGLHWQYKCQACHSSCPNDDEFPIRRCQR